MLYLYTSAPPVFDILGIGLCLFAALVAMGGSRGMGRTPSDPRFANYENLCFAIGAVPIWVYIFYAMQRGMGGVSNLLVFLIRVWDGHHSWTVWVTLAAWSALTAFSIVTIKTNFGKPLGNRATLPYWRQLCSMTFAGFLWWVGFYVPLIHWGTALDTRPVGTMINVFLFCCYIGTVTEGAAGLLLLLLPARSPARRFQQGQADNRNAPMIPARRRTR